VRHERRRRRRRRRGIGPSASWPLRQGGLLRRPGGGMQLVLLDHGMYRELGEHFRRSYCALWVRLLPREPQP